MQTWLIAANSKNYNSMNISTYAHNTVSTLYVVYTCHLLCQDRNFVWDGFVLLNSESTKTQIHMYINVQSPR